MKTYEYKGIKWTAKQTGNIVELTPFGVNGGHKPKFGKCVFAAMLASKKVVICHCDFIGPDSNIGENNYPILWTVSEGLKRDCVDNGVI